MRIISSLNTSGLEGFLVCVEHEDKTVLAMYLIHALVHISESELTEKVESTESPPNCILYSSHQDVGL